jgi:hypothetical protein
MNFFGVIVFFYAPITWGFVVTPQFARQNSVLHGFSTSGMWNAGLGFGKGDFKFYKSFGEWMKPFPEEDRQAYPELFNLPKGVYEVSLRKPLGIVFEEIVAGKGVFIQDLVEGGAAEQQGKIKIGDVLVGVTAVKVVGAKWERRMLPARSFDFDTVVGAISSNEPKWGCDDVVLSKFYMFRPCSFER